MRNLASLALALSLCATPVFAHHDKAEEHVNVHTSDVKAVMGKMELAQAKAGDIMIMNPMIRATPPAAPAAGGFVTLHNMGDTDDTLISASISADVAGKVELHTMEMDGDIMRMFEVEGGIPVPAGEMVQLMPGGLHIMLMGLKEGLAEGANHEVTLVFENSGEVTLPFSVLPLEMVREMVGAKMMDNSGQGAPKAHDH